MYCSVLSATVSGMEMIPVQVEADVSDGMPQFTMVGYVSAQVKEAHGIRSGTFYYCYS